MTLNIALFYEYKDDATLGMTSQERMGECSLCCTKYVAYGEGFGNWYGLDKYVR